MPPPAPRRLKLPVPVTIITGGLGSGKTTAIRALIASKPASEVWAVVVNEFGAVGIDGAAIQAAAATAAAAGGGGGDSGSAGSGGGTASGVEVRQIAGGCMCCVTSGVLTPALAQIVRQVKPDRLIIEPSGLGHPGGLVDILQGPHLASALQLNAIICLVDLSRFEPDSLAGVGVLADQVAIADVLVGSKADLVAGSGGDRAGGGGSSHACSGAPPAAAAAGAQAAGCAAAGAPRGAVRRFAVWAARLYPPKAQVLTSAQGQMDASLLDLPRAGGFAALTAAWRRQGGSGPRRRQGGSGGGGIGEVAAAAEQLAGLTVGGEGGGGDEPAASAAPLAGEPAPRAPVRAERGSGSSGSGGSGSACGWVFDQGDTFLKERLTALLQQLEPLVARLKGIFRVGRAEWAMPAQAAGGAWAVEGGGEEGSKGGEGEGVAAGGGGVRRRHQLVLSPVCYRGSSCVEVILQPQARSRPGSAPAAGDGGGAAGALAAAVASAHAGDWQPLEALLLGTLV